VNTNITTFFSFSGDRTGTVFLPYEGSGRGFAPVDSAPENGRKT
jgi:hypothetical protein